MENIFADWLKRFGSSDSEQLPRGPNEQLRQQKKMLSILADKETIARIDPDRETIL